MRLLLCLLALLLVPLRAAEAAQPPQGEGRKAKGENAPPLSPFALRPSPFFKPGDVIALVGGEDMVVASEYGYLELLLVRALPDYRLRFRNLAWEGDTVFEQRRDLNFPTWEEQLDKIGATVVIAQFGQMESLAGKEKLPEFIAAYEKLIERFSGGGKRRVVILSPIRFNLSSPWSEDDSEHSPQAAFLGAHAQSLREYATSIEEIAARSHAFYINFLHTDVSDVLLQRDGIHLTAVGHRFLTAHSMLWQLDLPDEADIKEPHVGPDFNEGKTGADRPLLSLIIAKNRLWFDYWRPQNWAFLAGDRTAQPSSRDHLDPSKRWFPPEREAFLPLIEAKEKEIDALAAQLATGK